MAAEFTHLHLHSTYSMLDGAIRVGDLVKYCAANNMPNVAVTDHGNMFGAIEFYEKAKKAGVKPILGCEFYVAPNGRFTKKNVNAIADGGAYHLVVLAKNEQGYKNLVKLCSIAYTEGFYRKPRIDYEVLEQYSAGLVGATACLGGEVPRKLMAGKYDEAAALAGRLKEVFEPGSFFLELQDHDIPEQKIVNVGLAEIAQKHEIPLVATNDPHFLMQNDRSAQTTLLRIQMGLTTDEDLRFAFNEHFYVKTPDEMAHLFRDFPDAVKNTMRIAEMCNVDLDFGNAKLPAFETPTGQGLNEYLYDIGMKGLRERYEKITPEVQQRFEHEYKTITNMDFAGYFLIVQDFIQHAKNNDIPVGPGRGSAAGSILSYSLGITNVDPLRYDLLFERFLNPDRNEMPDIDIDFCQERREEVIDYVRAKYGDDHVSQIITFGTLSAKAVVKDVSRVFKVPFAEANAITKMIPNRLDINLDEALQESKELAAYADKGPVEREVFAISKRLEGGVRHAGKHAAGIVISPAPIDEIVPVYRETGSTQNVTQWEKNAVEKIGLVKMDFLGLRNLTIIEYALRKIKERRGVDIDISTIPMDDEEVYALLSRGAGEGVFQLESSGMRELLVKSKPREFEDIVAILALYRPGPLNSGMVDEYIARKNGLKEVHYPHASLERVLKATYGVIVYQEQVMLISQIVGGFSMAEADKLRKAMGKKKKDIMEQLKAKFVDGAMKQDYDKKFAVDLYDMMAKFAEYGFNKSHSVAYALITYQTAWLKAHYKIEYMYALLKSEMGNSEGLVKYIDVCRSNGVTILGPDVNLSLADFSVEDDNTIRFGLAAIKNVGPKAADSIIKGRQDLVASTSKNFSSLFDLCDNVDLRQVNRKVLENIIYSGATDSLNESRATQFNLLDSAMSQGQRSQADRQVGQSSLFGAEEVASMNQDYERLPEWPAESRLKQEKEALGFYLSGHPLDKYRPLFDASRLIGLNELGGSHHDQNVMVGGMITNVRKLQTKKTKEDMAVIQIEDWRGQLSAVIFPKSYEKFRELVFPDSLLLLKGQYDHDDSGQSQLKVNELIALDESSLNELVQKEVHIILAPDLQNKEILDRIKGAVMRHQGESLVYFHLKSSSNKKVIQAHPHFGITLCPDFFHEMSDIVGAQNLYYTAGNEVLPLQKMPELRPPAAATQ